MENFEIEIARKNRQEQKVTRSLRRKSAASKSKRRQRILRAKSYGIGANANVHSLRDTFPGGALHGKSAWSKAQRKSNGEAYASLSVRKRTESAQSKLLYALDELDDIA